MTGSTHANLTPHLALTLRSTEGVEYEVEFVVDTGFDGELVLPLDLINQLGAVPSHAVDSFLADGRRVASDLYEVDVQVSDRWTTAYASPLGAALIGTRLMRGHRLSVDVVPGGSVTLTPLAR